MKSERRHELKTNTLARQLETLPEFGRRHGNKLMIALIGVLLVILLVRNRIASSREQAERAAFSLNHARALISQLEISFERVNRPEQMVAVAQQVARGGEEAVAQVLEATDDPRLLAEARLARGDLNWELANLPEVPGATTRPDLQLPKSGEQLLQAAADSYQAVVDSDSAPRESKTTARLSLGAVAENRRQWDKARDQYQKVVDDPAVPKPMKDLAVQALNRLPEIQKPVLLVPPSAAPAGQSSTPSATAPSATTPSTTPSSTTTSPATAPSTTAPSTVPATRPSTAPATNATPQPAKPG